MANDVNKKAIKEKKKPLSRRGGSCATPCRENPLEFHLLADIAAEARMPEDDLRALFPTKLSLLEAYGKQVDERVETRGKSISMDENMKDRLFEAIMIRLDILGDHRDAVASIIRATLEETQKP